MKRICQFISKYMGVLVFAAAVLAFIFPDALSRIRPKVINYLLGVVMFGMGLTLNLEDFKVVFSRPKDIIIGCPSSPSCPCWLGCWHVCSGSMMHWHWVWYW